MQFNDGAHGTSKALEQFSIKHGIYTNIIKHGIYTNIGSSKKDEISIRRSSTKSSKGGEKKRKRLCGIKKGVIDKNSELEKVCHIPGGFESHLCYRCMYYICYIEYVDLSLFKYFFSKYRFWSIFIQNLISSEVVSLFIKNFREVISTKN